MRDILSNPDVPIGVVRSRVSCWSQIERTQGVEATYIKTRVNDDAEDISISNLSGSKMMRKKRGFGEALIASLRLRSHMKVLGDLALFTAGLPPTSVCHW